MLKLLIAESDLSIAPLAGRIRDAVAKSEDKICQFLHINWDIDIVVTAIDYDVSYIGGIDGSTSDPYLIDVMINCSQIDSKTFQDDLVATIAHEANHCKRYMSRYHNFNRLNALPILDTVVMEGLAVAFEKEFAGHDTATTKFEDKPDEARKIFQIVKPYLGMNNDEIGDKLVHRWIVFGDPSSGLPLNAGYILGYWLVNLALKNLDVTASQATIDNVSTSELVVALPVELKEGLQC